MSSGFQQDLPTVWLCELLLHYLPRSRASALLEELLGSCQAASSRLVTDLQGELKVEKARQDAPGEVKDWYGFSVESVADCVRVLRKSGWLARPSDVVMVEEWA